MPYSILALVYAISLCIDQPLNALVCGSDGGAIQSIHRVIAGDHLESTRLEGLPKIGLAFAVELQRLHLTGSSIVVQLPRFANSARTYSAGLRCRIPGTHIVEVIYDAAWGACRGTRRIEKVRHAVRCASSTRVAANRGTVWIRVGTATGDRMARVAVRYQQRLQAHADN